MFQVLLASPTRAKEYATMKNVTTEQLSRPESDFDPEVIAVRKQFASVSPLDEIVRQGAQQMLQAAIESEVQDFLAQHADRVDSQGRKLFGNTQVKNGRLESKLEAEATALQK